MFDEVELVRLGALARDLGAGLHVDRLERAREAREAHAIEIAEVRNEPEESFEGVIAGIGHGARRLAGAARTLRGWSERGSRAAGLASPRLSRSAATRSWLRRDGVLDRAAGLVRQALVDV